MYDTFRMFVYLVLHVVSLDQISLPRSPEGSPSLYTRLPSQLSLIRFPICSRKLPSSLVGFQEFYPSS